MGRGVEGQEQVGVGRERKSSTSGSKDLYHTPVSWALAARKQPAWDPGNIAQRVSLPPGLQPGDLAELLDQSPR